MSYSPLSDSDHQRACDKCHLNIQDGDEVVFAMFTRVYHHPEGLGNYDLPPDSWTVSMDDWSDDLIYHNKCFNQMRGDQN